MHLLDADTPHPRHSSAGQLPLRARGSRHPVPCPPSARHQHLPGSYFLTTYYCLKCMKITCNEFVLLPLTGSHQTFTEKTVVLRCAKIGRTAKSSAPCPSAATRGLTTSFLAIITAQGKRRRTSWDELHALEPDARSLPAWRCSHEFCLQRILHSWATGRLGEGKLGSGTLGECEIC